MCFVIVLGLLMPRFVLFLLWGFSNYLDRAFDTFVWPMLGFFFLPTTTLGYAIAQSSYDGLEGGGLVFFVLGLLIDIGVIGGGRGALKNRRRT